MTNPAAIHYGTAANATLVFEVGTAVAAVDPATGNSIPVTETLTYQAAMKLAAPDWKKAEGVDQTTFGCNGRLLAPPVLDPRIVSGSKAAAVINGRSGRFELTEDLTTNPVMDAFVRSSLRGTFRLIGGAGNG